MRYPSRDHVNRLSGGLVWAGILILCVGGLACITLPPSDILPFTRDNPLLTSTFENIGYGLLGGGLTTLIFRLTAGLGETLQQERVEQSLDSLQQDIIKIPMIISEATEKQQRAIGVQQERILDLSKLLATASSLGIVAVAGERLKTPAFGGVTFVERWQYLLERAHKVDLLCWEDSKLLSYDIWQGQPGLADRVMARLRTGELNLRILLSARDNAALPMVNKWIGSPDYMQNQVVAAETTLRNAGVTQQFPNVLRRHNELLAFTLMRGDSELYIMYFFPKHGAGPIFQLAPSEVLEVVASGRGDKGSLYTSYGQYFDDLWDEYDPAKQQSNG